MRTYLDCFPCFFKQALRAGRLAGLSEEELQAVLVEFGGRLSGFSLDSPPPEIARDLYASIMRRAGRDPFREIKARSNRLALGLIPALKKRIRSASDPLQTAVRLAIAGNVIDYGVHRRFDLKEEIERTLKTEAGIFDYGHFQSGLREGGDILYLCDNAGEIIFDRLLIEEILSGFPARITAVVRGVPVLNDAVMEDAVEAGLENVCPVIGNGSAAPGTILGDCSDQFQKIYRNAGLVISKGQGNFETLWGERKRIFFLFKVKCRVVARHTNGVVGDTMLLASSGNN